MGDVPGNLDVARSLIRQIPDFPIPGIQFKDLTPLLADPHGLSILLEPLVERFGGEPIDAIVAIEARGFIFGGALAMRLGTGFVPARKKGKLPFQTDEITYETEYGPAILEMHIDALKPGARVLVVDDVLATGGTARAASHLVQRRGATVVAFAFILELEFLRGRRALEPTPVMSVLVEES